MQINQTSRVTLAAILLVAYVVLALEPFRWNPPQWVENGAVVAADGTIRFPEPGLLRARSAPEWLDSAIDDDALTIHLRVRSLAASQSSTARIFTVSAGTDLRNITIGQDRTSLVVRLRTPATSKNGMPPYRVSKVFKNSTWRDIEVAVRPRAIAITIDGRQVLDEPLPEHALAAWDRNFHVALGNELTGDRPWLGEIRQASVLCRGQEVDYVRETSIQRPTHYWSGLKWSSLWSLSELTQREGFLTDATLNFLCFVPLGFLITRQGGRRRSFILATILCATASLGVEFAQIGFDRHVPSVVDWVLNVSGAALGAATASFLLTQAGKQKEPRPDCRLEAAPQLAPLANRKTA